MKRIITIGLLVAQSLVLCANTDSTFVDGGVRVETYTGYNYSHLEAFDVQAKTIKALTELQKTETSVTEDVAKFKVKVKGNPSRGYRVKTKVTYTVLSHILFTKKQ